MNLESSEAGTAEAGSGQPVPNRANRVRWSGVVRAILTVLTATYVIAFFILLAGLEWVGERFWPFGILLYAPPQIFLAPLLILTPCSLLMRWRLCLWHVGCVAFLFLVYQPCRFASPPTAQPGQITAVTFNQGQSDEAQFASFVAEVKPDLILLQDAQWPLREFERRFPGCSVAGRGEFVLVSRFPIRQAALVVQAWGQGRPIATRFEVEVDGQLLAIYSVHITTPRQQLSRFLGLREAVRDLAGRGRRKAGAGDFQDWLRARCELARKLNAVFAGEKLPYIVGGDFNTPDHGYLYHLFAAEMTDAFAQSGRGWGLTFPANTRHPIAFFGPWLRLDYIFAGRGWRPLECWPEKGRKSQHRAVYARLAPVRS